MNDSPTVLNIELQQLNEWLKINLLAFFILII